MTLHPIRTIAAVLVASLVYIALLGPIGREVPGWIAAGVAWYPGLFLAFTLSFAITPKLDWWRYPLFVASTSAASFGVVVLITVLAELNLGIPYSQSITYMLVSAIGAISFCWLLRWIMGVSFLTWRRSLLIAISASLATLAATLLSNVTQDLTVALPLRVPMFLAPYTLLWWWSVVAALLWMQTRRDLSVVRENKNRSLTRGSAGSRKD